MGLYIPDLRLPADGDFELWIAVRKDGSFIYNVRGDWRGGKQKVFIVPPHGRLIDADKFKETLDYYISEAGWGNEINKALIWVKDEFIDSEQTVISASDEG